jgi:hypothetical protein
MAPRALARTLPKITRPTLNKRGAAFAALVGDWHNVVGPALAELSLPERLTRNDPHGVLTIRVANGGAAIEFQHLHAQILERINGYLGFAAVARIVLRQAPLPSGGAPAPRLSPRPLSLQKAQQIAAETARIEDAQLRETLERFGRALAQNDED